MILSPYNQEHLEAFQAARTALGRMTEDETAALRVRIQPYVDFRKEVASFQQAVAGYAGYGINIDILRDGKEITKRVVLNRIDTRN